MAVVTLVFPDPLNASLQIGDTAYYVQVTDNWQSSGFMVNENSGGTNYDIVEVGVVTAITQSTNTIVIGNSSLMTSQINGLDVDTHYFFFSKDNKANLSSLLGYYAEIKLKNTSTSEAELFSIGSDYFESSK